VADLSARLRGVIIAAASLWDAGRAYSKGRTVTAIPQQPGRLLTVEQYAALGEDERGRYELQEGSLVVSPSPRPHHAKAMGRLFLQLTQQMPDHLDVLLDIDVDLELVPVSQPGFVRRPDLIIADKAAPDRAEADGRLIRASEVRIVIELVSSGLRRLDNVIKRGEYADAGIPYYWIVDIEPPVSLLQCHLTEEFGYIDDGAVTGAFSVSDPFPVSLDLRLLRSG
jgi:Uma2 family endonuclease